MYLYGVFYYILTYSPIFVAFFSISSNCVLSLCVYTYVPSNFFFNIHASIFLASIFTPLFVYSNYAPTQNLHFFYKHLFLGISRCRYDPTFCLFLFQIPYLMLICVTFVYLTSFAFGICVSVVVGCCCRLFVTICSILIINSATSDNALKYFKGKRCFCLKFEQKLHSMWLQRSH